MKLDVAAPIAVDIAALLFCFVWFFFGVFLLHGARSIFRTVLVGFFIFWISLSFSSRDCIFGHREREERPPWPESLIGSVQQQQQQQHPFFGCFFWYFSTALRASQFCMQIREADGALRAQRHLPSSSFFFVSGLPIFHHFNKEKLNKYQKKIFFRMYG